MKSVPFLSFLAPKPPVPYVRQKDFLSVIELAQKQDHQIYTEKKLKILDFSLNAAMPGILNIITSPYRMVKTGFQYSEIKLVSLNKYLQKAKLMLLADLVSLLCSSLKPLLYLTYVGVAALEIKILITIIFATALTSCIIGLITNIYDLFRQSDFLKNFDGRELESLSSAIKELKSENYGHAKAHFQKFLTEAKSFSLISPEDLQLITELSSLIFERKTQDEGLLKPLSELENKLIFKFYKRFEEKYLCLSSQEKKDILTKGLSELKQHPLESQYPAVLHKTLDAIQQRFRRKKIILADKIHITGALEVINEAKEISKELTVCEGTLSETSKEKILNLMGQLKRKAQAKKEVMITNIALYSIGIISLSLTMFLHVGMVVTVAFFLLSMGLYYLNETKIKSYLEQDHSSLQPSLLLPKWVKKAHSLCMGLFESKKGETDTPQSAAQPQMG